MEPFYYLHSLRNTNESKNVSVYSNSTDDQYTEQDGS